MPRTRLWEVSDELWAFTYDLMISLATSTSVYFSPVVDSVKSHQPVLSIKPYLSKKCLSMMEILELSC